MRLTLAILCLFLAGQVLAKNIYVSQAGGGSTNSLAWLTNTANWNGNSSTVLPGDTVYLEGTFTNYLVLPPNDNGTSGNYITILFDTNANFTSGMWTNTGAINIVAASWLIIDGGYNGLIQDTNNGAGLGITNGECAAIASSIGQAQLTNCIIRNLTFSNMLYSDITITSRVGGETVEVWGNNIIISNCTFSMCDTLLQASSIAGYTNGNITIISNRFYNFVHAINAGIDTSFAVETNLFIIGNYFAPLYSFNNGGSHLDCIIMSSGGTTNGTSCLSNVWIYNNYFDGQYGPHTTAAIYGGMQNPLQNQIGLYIYNNIFLSTSNQWGNGWVSVSGSNIWCFNNTCIGTNLLGQFVGGRLDIGGLNAYCYNNLILDNSFMVLSAYTFNVSGITAICGCASDGTNYAYLLSNYCQTVWADFNIYADSPNISGSIGIKSSFSADYIFGPAGLGTPLTDWQTWNQDFWNNTNDINNDYGPITNFTPYLTAYPYNWCQLHADPHSTTNVPTFNAGTWIPATNDMVALAQGTNLTSLGVATDYRGNLRPASGNWTIGAYEAAYVSPTVGLTVSVGGNTVISNAIFR
jgi:hypothetical protein